MEEFFSSIYDQRVKDFLKVLAIPLIPFHNSISFPEKKKKRMNLITLQNLPITFMYAMQKQIQENY